MAFSFPWASLLGGMLLGVSATLLLIFNGKIAGISGILGGLFKSTTGDKNWRFLFLLGMVFGGGIFTVLLNRDTVNMIVSTPLVIIAGLLVGLGTKIGNGCTSGHGICGIGRFSMRSIVATVTFISVAMITTFFMLHLI